MKQLIILVGLLSVSILKAETYDRTQMLDYVPVKNMDFAFEIKTAKFQKVILDCQSFITGMNFYNDNKMVHSIYLDAYGDCQGMHQFLQDSKDTSKPVCLQIDIESNDGTESKTLTVSNEIIGCQ